MRASPRGRGGSPSSRCRARSAAGSVTRAKPRPTPRRWQLRPANGEDAQAISEAADLADRLAELIVTELTSHQREVLIALAIDGVDSKDLATRLNSTQGALYKTLHDARRKLKHGLADREPDDRRRLAWLEIVRGARRGQTPRAADARVRRGIDSHPLSRTSSTSIHGTDRNTGLMLSICTFEPMAPSSAAAEDKHMSSPDRVGAAPRPASQARVNLARLRAGKGLSLDVRAKRVYDRAEPQDGYRVLIDHVWPRGISRDRARLDRWARRAGPSDALRKWFDHRPSRFAAVSRPLSRRARRPIPSWSTSGAAVLPAAA